MAKRKKKNPFVSYTEEQVLSTEAVTYVIQAGSDLFDVDGVFAFDKLAAEEYYKKILREVTEQTQSGSRNQRMNAKRVLMNLRVMPLRIH